MISDPMTPSQPTSHRAGILLAILTTLMFASMDGVSKFLGGRFPVAEIVWFQYVVVTGFALAFAVRSRDQSEDPSRGGHLFTSHFPAIQVLRGVLLAIETALFVLAFRYLPLADAHAVGAAAPLIATALAVPFLKERVNPARWAAVLAGFVGVLIIIRPGSGVFGVTALIPVAAAVLFALYQILTRMAGDRDPVATSLIYTGVVGLALCSAVLPFVWVTPSIDDLALLLLGGCFGAVAHFSLIKALSLVPATVIQPFNYTLLLWASVIGFLVFGDIPDLWTAIGAVVVIASGLYIFYKS
jgi:drug/metabolite transporter (DMT)-like permease